MLKSDIDILTTSDRERWRQVVQEIGSYDFYHLPEFHRLAEMRGEGRAVMPVIKSGKCLIAFPLLIRDISGQPGLRDATSVNGFAGPVSNCSVLPEEIKQQFREAMCAYFIENMIVTAYSRLHPLTCSGILDGFGETREVGVLLSIDLSLPPEEQFRNFRRDHRKDIRRQKKMDYVCELGSLNDLDEVTKIYRDTMIRVNADTAFLYEKEYFHYLLTEMPDVMRLFVCRHGGKIATFKLFSFCTGILSPYVSGTAYEFVKESPSRILYDALRIWGNENGAKRIHLGGGVGAQRDQLYNFKKGLASDEHAYKTWRLIVDPEAYQGICSNAGSSIYDTHYFPAYRNAKAITA